MCSECSVYAEVKREKKAKAEKGVKCKVEGTMVDGGWKGREITNSCR